MDKDLQVSEKVIIKRTFNVPLDFLWRAWTDPEVFKRWWGPKGFTCPYCTIDLRPGGKYLFCMRSPEGQEIWGTGIYQKVEPHKLLVNSDSFADKDGNVVAATHYGMSEDFPLEMIVEVSFKDEKGRSSFTLKHSGLPSVEIADQTRQGWNESFDKIEDLYTQYGTRSETKIKRMDPYLNFNGNAEEAFNFYKSVFGGEFISIQRFKDVPFTENVPPEVKEKIMHVSLKIGGNILMATDVIESLGHRYTAGNNFSISLSVDSKQEADRIFSGLSQGGSIEQAMRDEFWGAYFGMLVDKFGVRWMISYDPKGQV